MLDHLMSIRPVNPFFDVVFNQVRTIDFHNFTSKIRTKTRYFKNGSSHVFVSSTLPNTRENVKKRTPEKAIYRYFHILNTL